MSTIIFSAADPITLSDDELFEVLSASRDGEMVERRTTPRHPCFAAVTLLPINGSRMSLSAFSRDLSCDGLGLLHNMPLERGAIYQVVLRHRNGELRRPAQVMWNRSAGEGWYVSGWRFVKSPV